MNLYDDLGVSEDATEDEIKKAHREKVNETHPDKGGDADEFCAVQKAWEILGDPDKREKYDKTGATEEVNTDTQAAANFVLTFKEIMIAHVQAGRHETTDIIKETRNALKQKLSQVESSISQARKQMKELGKVQKRLKRKDGNPVVESMLDEMNREKLNAIKTLEEGVEVFKKAIVICDNYEYEADERESIYGWHGVEDPHSMQSIFRGMS